MNYLEVSDLELLRVLPFVHLHNTILSAPLLVNEHITLTPFLEFPVWSLCVHRPCVLHICLSFCGKLLLFFFKTQLKHLIPRDIFHQIHVSCLLHTSQSTRHSGVISDFCMPHFSMTLQVNSIRTRLFFHAGFPLNAVY